MNSPMILSGRLSAAAVLLAACGTLADVTPQGGMLRYPDVSREHVAFVYAGDIWLAPRAGGPASRLTTATGQELFPKFSPDGKTVAFVGNYDGNRDLYTIPVEGGIATRVTHHPSGETLCDWTPDGRSLLFYTSGLGGLRRQTQLFTVPAAGGMFEQVSVPYGANGAISGDGSWLAYTPHTTDFRTWKRYRGGMATDVWLFNLRDKSSKKITEWEGTDSIPMWWNDRVYYLSDEGSGNGAAHRLNIWEYHSGTGKRRQVTALKDHDVKWPSIGPGGGAGGRGEIVFQAGSGRYVVDAAGANPTPKQINVTIPGDRPMIRSRQVNAAEFIQGWSISPSGKRIAVEGRGDVWTLPAEQGSPRALTRTSGNAERDPSWSPDGKWIAYFGDATGEYELYLTQSDGQGPTHLITTDGSAPQVYRYNPVWSPDSKRIAFADKTGALYLSTLGEPGEDGGFGKAETTLVDTDPWSGRMTPSWSSDSAWIAYARDDEDNRQGVIWLYNVATGKKQRVTSTFFDDTSPTFDRKGDWLFFTSKRSFSPTYSELDTTFIYQGTMNLVAVPLRKDMDSPWAPKSDEEDWRAGGAKKDDADKAEKKDEKKDGEKKENGEKSDAAADDPVTGTWEGRATGPDPIPPGGMPFTLRLKLEKGNKVTGSITCPLFTGDLVPGTFDPATGRVDVLIPVENGEVALELTVKDGQLTGKAVSDGRDFPMTAQRAPAGKGEVAAADEGKGEKKGKAKEVVIDLDGMEARAVILPVPAGRFGRLAVNDKNQLIYARMPVGQGGEPGIKLFDLADEKKEEKTVAGGASNFELTADGKRALVIKGRTASIQDASAGSTAKNIPTAGMTALVEPREEWRQIFSDAWRIQRDFFYDPGMHGVDWKGMREHYGKMLADCSSRDDVSFVIAEMISELNVGHAYYSGGDIESGPSVGVGLLGCDFELVPAEGGEGGKPAAYRISRIYRGAEWDVDAKGPLTQPGVNVKEGDFLLAVNGVPVDPSQDPWRAFQGLAGRVTTITVSDTPVLDRAAAEAEAKLEAEAAKKEAGGGGADKAGKKDEDKDKPKKKTTGLRDVVVACLSSEDDLRYRAWIEAKRQYVEEKTGGKVGYVYVPDTGQNGQNNLFRQFYGQIGKQAVIIDERWNGGGQIPTRFIELLNRPVTNYWARRDGKDWMWPPDSHQGPKCMLINGLAGSGGDAFPSYFRQNKLGKLIGMRTWGGLVGISGNPGLIDGGNVTAPTFGFYKTDGNWGIEGHGVDPDIEVVDDPAKMQPSMANPYGADPQLDRAVELMLEEIRTRPFIPPAKPEYPDRSGMGLPEKDR
ncbi:MAG: PDZ domain-containing protein [Phycisphaerales bacterium]